jgi:Skp family chaperone for outer membrane proteins
MNKLLIALTIALLAIPTLFAGSAEAGHRRHGFHNAFHHLAAINRAKRASEQYRRKKAHRAAKIRARREAAYAARKARAVAVARAQAQAEAQAEAQEQAEAEVASKDVRSQNSSITTADGQVTASAGAQAEPKAEKVAIAEDLGCKQFFPSVGLTLTVPCE